MADAAVSGKASCTALRLTADFCIIDAKEWRREPRKERSYDDVDDIIGDVPTICNEDAPSDVDRDDRVEELDKGRRNDGSGLWSELVGGVAVRSGGGVRA